MSSRQELQFRTQFEARINPDNAGLAQLHQKMCDTLTRFHITEGGCLIWHDTKYVYLIKLHECYVSKSNDTVWISHGCKQNAGSWAAVRRCCWCRCRRCHHCCFWCYWNSTSGQRRLVSVWFKSFKLVAFLMVATRFRKTKSKRGRKNVQSECTLRIKIQLANFMHSSSRMLIVLRFVDLKETTRTHLWSTHSIMWTPYICFQL